jgi:hypothetical protein
MALANVADETQTIDVATFSSARVFRWGLYMILRSFVWWFIVAVPLSALLIYHSPAGGLLVEGSQQSASDTHMSATQTGVAWGLALVLALLTAFTYIRSSYCKSYYFRAGPRGIDINLPRYRVFTYRLEPQQFSWNEIGEITQWIYTFNGITVINRLDIEGLKKKRVFVHYLRHFHQFLFREPIPSIIARLEEIRAKSPYKPEPIV